MIDGDRDLLDAGDTMGATAVLMTTEELLTLPEDGIHRELIRGELRESSRTTRNYPHSRSNIRVGHILLEWLEGQPRPRGDVVGGEARFRIRRDPDTTVGIDVAYISAALAAVTEPLASFVDGPPVLAIEIVSPTDTHEEIAEKVQDYLDAGVPVVWVVDPYFRTVMVHRPDAAPTMFNETQELVGDPHLPGFRAAVSRIFDA